MVKLSELLSLTCIGAGANKQRSQLNNAAISPGNSATRQAVAGHKGSVLIAEADVTKARRESGEHISDRSVLLDCPQPQHSFASPQCDLAIFAGEDAVSSRQETPAVENSGAHSLRQRANRSSSSLKGSAASLPLQQATVVTVDVQMSGSQTPGGHHQSSGVAAQQQPSIGQKQHSTDVHRRSMRSTSNRAPLSGEGKGSTADSMGLRNAAASNQHPQLNSSNLGEAGEISRGRTFDWMLQTEEEAAGTVFTVDLNSDGSNDAKDGVPGAADSTAETSPARSYAHMSLPLPHHSPSIRGPAGGPRQQPQDFSSLPTLALMLLSSSTGGGLNSGSSATRSSILSALRGCSSSHSSRHGSTAPLLETIPSGEAVLLTTGDEDQWEAASAASQFGSLFSGRESPCAPATPTTSPDPATPLSAKWSIQPRPGGATPPSTPGGAGSAMPPRTRWVSRSASASGWSALASGQCSPRHRSNRHAAAAGAAQAVRGSVSSGGRNQVLRQRKSCSAAGTCEDEADGAMPLLLL